MGWWDAIKNGISNMWGGIKKAASWTYDNVLKPGYQWGKGLIGGLMKSGGEITHADGSPLTTEEKLNNAGRQSGSIFRGIYDTVKPIAPALMAMI